MLKKAFELIHLDLKSFPIDSYQKYKYLIIFIDDYIVAQKTVHMFGHFALNVLFHTNL